MSKGIMGNGSSMFLDWSSRCFIVNERSAKCMYSCFLLPSYRNKVNLKFTATKQRQITITHNTNRQCQYAFKLLCRGQSLSKQLYMLHIETIKLIYRQLCTRENTDTFRAKQNLKRFPCSLKCSYRRKRKLFCSNENFVKLLNELSS